MTDYYAHTYFDDPKRADNEVVDDDFDVDELLAEINAEAEAEAEQEVELPDDFEDV